MPDAALPLFEFEGQPLRVHLDAAGEPWFVAKDVALALGYQWNGSARIAHVPEESEPPAKRVVCSGPVRACYRLRLKTLAFTLFKPSALAALATP